MPSSVRYSGWLAGRQKGLFGIQIQWLRLQSINGAAARLPEPAGTLPSLFLLTQHQFFTPKSLVVRQEEILLDALETQEGFFQFVVLHKDGRSVITR